MTQAIRSFRSLVGAFLAIASLCFNVGAAERGRPNIVILVADDWGFSDVGAFGGEIATPHLDALAARGSRFSNFHVAATCSPTRAMLLTGVDHHRNGVGNMPETTPPEQEGKPGYAGVLAPDTVTLATMLRDSGYHTYIAGKWHVGKEPENLPGRRGFERSFIQADSGTDNWENRPYMMLYDKTYWFEQDRPAQLPKDFYSSRFFVDKTIGYIREQAADGKPFMAYIGFQANHIPIQAPAEFVAKYRGRYDQGWTVLRQSRRDGAIRTGMLPAGMPMATLASTVAWDSLTPDKQRQQARRMEVYAGMAEAMDHHIGRLIAHLKSTGEYDNTVFLFMSDNGAEASDPYALALGRLWLDMHYKRDIDGLGGKGSYAVIGPNWASAATAPMSTYKFFAGEGGIRVPLVIAGVKGMAKPQVHASLTHVNDIVPTLLDLAQVQHPGTRYKGQEVEPLSGHSLLPVLQGQVQRVRGPEEILGYELSGNQAIFKGDYKLLKNMPPVGDNQWHLFDIVQDPGETKDLQSAMPELFQSLQIEYEKWAKANGVLPMPQDYDPIDQVMINSAIFVYWPRHKWHLTGLLVVLAGLAWVWRKRRTLRKQLP